MVYAVTRKGVFHCNFPLTDYKCGLASNRSFRYVVEVRAKKLDKQGFVLDNHLIQQYFDRTYLRFDGDFVSCELMCARAITPQQRGRIVNDRTLLA